MSAVKVVHVFHGVSMSCSFDGLAVVLRRNAGKGPLAPGEVALFVNTNGKAAKLLCPDETILYHRDGKGLTVDAIVDMPLAVGGKRLAMSEALRRNLARAIEDITEATKEAA